MTQPAGRHPISIQLKLEITAKKYFTSELRPYVFVHLLFLLLLPVTSISAAAEPIPPNLTRFNPAGLSHEWIYEGSAFNALRAPDNSHKSVAVIRLQHIRSGFFLTVSETEAKQAEASGFIRQGIAFHTPAKSSLPVHRFKDSDSGAYYYSTSHKNLPNKRMKPEGIAFYAFTDAPSAHKQKKAPSKQDVPVPVARYRNKLTQNYFFTAGKESPYQVGAFYFGSFSPSAQKQIDGTAKIYGRRGDWWGGVSDFYGKEPGIPANRRKWDGNWDHLKPAIGYYNQQSVETLKKHIQQASDAGLSFFSFYWYWSNKKNNELFPEALDSFLKANVDGRLKYNFTLYAHPWNEDLAITPVNSAKVIDTIIGHFANKNYLRLPDGRPVFSMGDHRNIRNQEGAMCSDTTCYTTAVDTFLAALKRASLKRLGVEPYIQIQAGAPGWDKARETDSITCIVPPIKYKGGLPYPELEPSVFTPLTNAKKPVSACMFQNFDERPRQDVLIPDRGDIRYFVGKTAAALRHNMETTKQFVDTEYAKTNNPIARVIYLYAWNEWHEGGILEPNVATGAQDLNIVTDVFQLPRSPSRCLEKGDCL